MSIISRSEGELADLKAQLEALGRHSRKSKRNKRPRSLLKKIGRKNSVLPLNKGKR